MRSTAVIVSRPEGGRRFAPREPERSEETRAAVESASGRAAARCPKAGFRASEGDVPYCGFVPPAVPDIVGGFAPFVAAGIVGGAPGELCDALDGG